MIKVPEPVLNTLAAAFGVSPASLTYLGGGQLSSDGITYTYFHDEKPFVLKILALSAQDPDHLLRLEERLKFVYFLGEHGAPIVHPLARSDGSLYITCLEGEHLFVAYTYRKIVGGSAGRMPWFDAIARPWGAAIGKLHRLTQSYPTWQNSPVGDTGRSVLGWREEWEGFYEWCKDADVRKCWISIRERLEALPVRRDSFGFIHNDPHAENLLVLENGVTLLDFDVANYHWFINDIAIALQAMLFKQTGGLDRPLENAAPLRQFLDSFMEGYCWENTLDPFWLGQIDLFIAYRRILMFTVLQDWLRHKPSQRRSIKTMILEEPPILG